MEIIDSIKGEAVNGGKFTGEAVVSNNPFGFYGAVDPNTGMVSDKRHELYGQYINGKVFVFPEGRGSTAGAIVILELARCGTQPGAIINRITEPILATGAILARKFYGKIIPTIHKCEKDPIEHIRTGDIVEVDADKGSIVIKKTSK